MDIFWIFGGPEDENLVQDSDCSEDDEEGSSCGVDALLGSAASDFDFRPSVGESRGSVVSNSFGGNVRSVSRGSSSSIGGIQSFRVDDFREKVTEILFVLSKSVFMTSDELAIASNLCQRALYLAEFQFS